jgi:hypothetical protein
MVPWCDVKHERPQILLELQPGSSSKDSERQNKKADPADPPHSYLTPGVY